MGESPQKRKRDCEVTRDRGGVTASSSARVGGRKALVTESVLLSVFWYLSQLEKNRFLGKKVLRFGVVDDPHSLASHRGDGTLT